MSARQEIIIDLYHPEFRRGYLDGRRDSVRKKGAVINKQFALGMCNLFEDSEPEEPNEDGTSVYYLSGYFIGQLSVYAIPRIPGEEIARDLRETFLLTVKEKYGSAGESRIETIRQYWTGQDQLAQILDPDLFEQMITLGAYTGAL